MSADPVAAEERLLFAGVDTLSAPEVNENVVLVSAACALGANRPATANPVMTRAATFRTFFFLSVRGPGGREFLGKIDHEKTLS
jgi:hypothetical protein